MTEREWAILAAEIEATFRGDFAEDREAAMKTHVGSFPFSACRGAIRGLVMKGQTWLPSPAEFVAAVRRSAGERELRAWLNGYDEPEEFEADYTRAALGDATAKARLARRGPSGVGERTLRELTDGERG